MDNVSIIITASGLSTRWNREIAPHKQLVRLPDGRFLIQRTIDLLTEAGYRNIFVATVHDEIRKAVQGVKFIHPRNHHSLSDTILSSVEFFSDRVVVLLGDVFFSRDALRQIMQCQDAIRFFGKKTCSDVAIGKEARRSEIYALSFSDKAKETALAALEKNSLNAALQCRSRRLDRMVLRWKRGGVNEHLQREYLSCAPLFLRTKGFKPNRFWWFLRVVAGKRNRHAAWRYGRLWGLYMELTNTPVSDDEACYSLDNGAHLFTQIDDITQDIDYEEDYRELLCNLSGGTVF